MRRWKWKNYYRETRITYLHDNRWIPNMGKIRGPERAKGKTTGKRTSSVSKETLINKYLNANGIEKEHLFKIIKRIDPDFKG